MCGVVSRDQLVGAWGLQRLWMDSGFFYIRSLLAPLLGLFLLVY